TGASLAKVPGTSPGRAVADAVDRTGVPRSGVPVAAARARAGAADAKAAISARPTAGRAKRRAFTRTILLERPPPRSRPGESCPGYRRPQQVVLRLRLERLAE